MQSDKSNPEIEEETPRMMKHIECELRIIRQELQHQRELTEQRLVQLEDQEEDHETRLRNATEGVTQFRLWTSLSSGGSTILSVAALIKSFFS